MRALFPFTVATNLGYGIAYVFQAINVFYVLLFIVSMENICLQAINQIALHIDILTIKYSKIGMSRKKKENNKLFQRKNKLKLQQNLENSNPRKLEYLEKSNII